MTTSHLTRRGFLAATMAGATVLTAGCLPNAPLLDSLGVSDNRGFALWTGVPGAKFGDPVNKATGPRRIKGPRTWTHPITGKRMTIYVRTKWEKTGTKTSYYTMRADGTALARVFDSRPGRADRYYVGDAFMPTGAWPMGLPRSYKMTEHSRGKVERYTVSINVTKPSFTHKGIPGSMQYVWTQRSPDGRKIRQLRYTYSPGKGLVDVANLMKK